MKHVKQIFVVLLICSLTAFVKKDKPTGGLSEGDVAPDFKIESVLNGQPIFKLRNLKGRYVLLSFWASYDAQSRIQNVSLSNTPRSPYNVEMVSISFDKYQPIFKRTVRKDQVITSTCFMETEGEDPGLFKKYHLNRGSTDYLLDGDDIIIARNISAADLSAYVKEVSQRFQECKEEEGSSKSPSNENNGEQMEEEVDAIKKFHLHLYQQEQTGLLLLYSSFIRCAQNLGVIYGQNP